MNAIKFYNVQPRSRPANAWKPDVDCGRVSAILKGEVSYINGTTYLASQVTYECTPGNRLSGHRVRFCGPDGRWTGTSPKCEEIRCDAPELPSNGSAIYIGNDRSFKEQSFSVGVTVQYECDFGHVVKGSWASRLCQANGEWSGEAPVCRFVDCGLPSPIENGNYVLKHPPSGTVGSATPLETVRRSDSPSSMTAPTNQLTYYGAIAHYNCDPNFKLNGPPQRECLESGQWRQPLPVCDPVQCPKPDFFDEFTQVSLLGRISDQSSSSALGGQHSSDQSLSSSVSASSRSTAIRLISNNQWINHELSQQVFGVGDRLHYSCIPGFELYGGPESRICTQYGQWSGSSTPRCRPIDCGRPAPIGQEGRFYLLNDSTTFNSIVEYSCVRPFKLIEQKIRQAGNLIETLQTAQAGVTQILTSLPIGVKVCANNGQWMPNDQQPRCVSASSDVTGIANGQFDGTDNTLDSSIRHQMAHGSSTPTLANGNSGGSGVPNHNLGDAIGDDSGLFDSSSGQPNHQLNQLGNATSLWAKIIIAICLMVMFGLIMLTLICIRSGKKSNKQAQRTILASNTAGAMQIQLASNNGSNGAVGQLNGKGGIQQANQNIYMNSANHKIFPGVLVAAQGNQVSSIHHMTTTATTAMNMSHEDSIGKNQQSLMMNPLGTGGGRPMISGTGGDIMMNGKSSSLGLVAGSERHLNGNINEHSMSLSSANIIDSYSRLSIDSDLLDSRANQSSSTAKTIRHNPNGLVTFVSPAQQHNKQNSASQQSNSSNSSSSGGSQNHNSPQSISTSLSISTSSSPSSSSSVHHTNGTRFSAVDTASSSSAGSTHPITGHQIPKGDYQSPQQSFTQLQQNPPSLPAHPPPSHRLQHHKLVVVKKQQQQQQQLQFQGQQYDAQSSMQGKILVNSHHHYMDPSS